MRFEVTTQKADQQKTELAIVAVFTDKQMGTPARGLDKASKGLISQEINARPTNIARGGFFASDVDWDLNLDPLRRPFFVHMVHGLLLIVFTFYRILYLEQFIHRLKNV